MAGRHKKSRLPVGAGKAAKKKFASSLYMGRKEKAMVCSVCGQETYKTYALDGGELCRDCLLDAAEDPQLVEDKLPDFIAQHIKEYVDWVCDTTAGDCYGIQDYVERAKAQAVLEWALRNRDSYLDSARDFRTSRPGEWEDYLENLEGRE